MKVIMQQFKANIILVIAIFIFGGTVSAEDYRFNIVAGNWNPSTIHWKIYAPCHSTVSVTLSAKRFDGGFSSADDVPIYIEFRKPGVPLTSSTTVTREFAAKLDDTREATFTASGIGVSVGCDTAWTVRLRPKVLPLQTMEIRGTVKLGFTRNPISIDVEDAISLGKGQSLVKNIGGTSGLSQGWVEITGKWNHSVFGLPGPLPVKLNFELLRPDLSIAAYDTGYSSHEFNPCCSGDKAKIRFLVSDHKTGQWKIRIRNDTSDDVMSIVPKVMYIPACL